MVFDRNLFKISNVIVYQYVFHELSIDVAFDPLVVVPINNAAAGR